MIRIISRQDHPHPTRPWEVRVDRGTVFAHPHKGGTHGEHCDQYERWFYDHLPYLMPDLDELIDIYRAHGQLVLMCWCAPDRCHAETIRDWLLEELK